jgi:ATP-dependent Clp protease ATP-binding subunit ClpA
VARTRRVIAALRDPGTSASTFGRIADGIQKRMTPRLVTALQVAAVGSDGRERTTVGSLNLLGGLLRDVDNLAVRLLLGHGVDIEALAEATTAGGSDEPRPPGSPAAAGLLERLTMPARLAFASALETVVDMGHNYIGCEHLLVGLALSEGRAGDLLREHNIDATALRQAIGAVAIGVVHERTGSADEIAGALADLTRRLEAMERRLATTSGAASSETDV